MLAEKADQHGVKKGTAPEVAHPSAPNLELIMWRTAGRLASLAIEDWFAGHLNDGFYEWRCSELRDPFRQFSDDAGSDHDLIIIQTQSFEITDKDTGDPVHHISSMCKYCRYHFVFKIRAAKNADPEMHHLICKSADYYHDVDPEDPKNPSVKTYPLQGKATFSCSACHAGVEIEVSLPRLKTEWLNLLADEDRVRKALEKAKAAEPDRFLDMEPQKEINLIKNAVFNLNMYLKDVLTDGGLGPIKRISFRNKNFMVQFGPACEPIFRYLGFGEEFDRTRDEYFWVPPRLPKYEGKTTLGSQRAFYEDVRSEVQSILDQNPPAQTPVVLPLGSPRDQIEDALSCRNYFSRPSKPIKDSEKPDFRILGVSGDANDQLLKYAYTKQCEVDPDNRAHYLNALARLAGERGYDLQMFVFEQREKAAPGNTAAQMGGDMTPREKPYAHFALRTDSPGGPEFFISVFNAYREQSPAQKHEHRIYFLQIGKDKESDLIISAAYKTPWEVSEAYNLVSAGDNWTLESIALNTQVSINEGMDLKLAIMALEVISEHRPVDDKTREGFESILAQLRSQLDVPPRVSPEDGKTGNQDSVALDLPPGLANLRNTCYLNSILQYFYSVKAVRNLVLGLERPSLEPTEQHLQALLSGTDSSQLETGRAFVGHEFARELQTLFRELESCAETSVTPRQRLANAALLRPEKMRPQSQQVASVSDPSPGDAPPLPPRAGEGSHTKVTVESVPELSETASNVSSQTLVNQPDEDPSYVVVDRDTSTAQNGSYPTAPLDVEMTTEQGEPQSTSHESSGANARQSKLTVEELSAELEKPNIGSDQMDVDEVMGNAIDHLRAAFKVAHLERPGAVPDPIEEAFFSTFVDHRKKVGDATWNRSTRTDRWVTAYPAKSGTRDIYEALGNSFDLEILPGGLLSFTTIDRPAPNFHICIQRTDGVAKNANPIEIRDRLFLDRFMESRHNDPEMFRAKKRSSDLNTRLNELTSKDNTAQLASKEVNFVKVSPNNAATDKVEISAEDIDEFIHGDYMDVATEGQDDDGWSILSTSIKDVFARYDLEAEAATTTAENASTGAAEQPEPVPDKPRSEITAFWDKFFAEEEDVKKTLLEERAKVFENVKEEVEYRLHAVVCHAGSSAAAGHYWVWIHDFEQDVWRKYNDTRVSVHPADFVFQELTTKGEPYYLAYVRARDIPDLVNVPRRRASTQLGSSIDPSLQSGSGDLTLPGGSAPLKRIPSVKDTPMADADDQPVVGHFEDVGMSAAAN